MMLWTLLPAVLLYFFRGKIAARLSPYVGQLSPQKTALYGHISMLVGALLYILPVELLGLGTLKRPAYLLSLWSAACTMMWSIYANYGAPPMPQASISLSNWRQSLQTVAMTLQPWLQKAMNGLDFHFLFFVLIFLPAYPSVVALLILARRSLWSVGTQCSKEPPSNRLWTAFSPTWTKLKALEPEVLNYSVMAEILLGFWLAVSLLLPSRQILTCLLYWNFLKTRYNMPRSRELHTQAWAKIATTANPVLKHLLKVSLLQKGLDAAKGWFAPPHC